MTEYIEAARKYLVEAQQWHLGVLKEELAAVKDTLAARKRELEYWSRKNGYTKIALSYVQCLDKKVWMRVTRRTCGHWLMLRQAQLDDHFNSLSESERSSRKTKNMRKLIDEKHTVHMDRLEQMMRQHYLRNPEWAYPVPFLVKQGWTSEQLSKSE